MQHRGDSRPSFAGSECSTSSATTSGSSFKYDRRRTEIPSLGRAATHAFNQLVTSGSTLSSTLASTLSWDSLKRLGRTRTGLTLLPDSPCQRDVDKKRGHVQDFQGVSRKDVTKLVREGEILQKDADEEQYTKWTQWRAVLARFWHYRSKTNWCNYHFVVVDDKDPFQAELRWGQTYASAVGDEPVGRIMFADVRYVTATVLRDDDVISDPKSINQTEKKAREFRVVCASRTLKLWAPSRDSMKIWVTAIMQLSKYAQGSNAKFQRITIEHMLEEVVLSNMATSDKLADLVSVKMNIKLTGAQVREIMSKIGVDIDADKNHIDVVTLTEFFIQLTIKDSLSYLFSKYAVPSNPADPCISESVITAERFQAFLEVEQKNTFFFSKYTHLQDLFAQLEEQYRVESASGELALTKAGFSYLMCCAENCLFDPSRRAEVTQDMSRPLSHYWIASSHNTYLEGHQLVGQSSLKQYIEVLMNGCRCVEIDCWDGDAGEPIVKHGWTMTSQILFCDVIRVCRDYGFAVSNYPLILSLEVHCGAKQRERMGIILHEILGDSLLVHSGHAPLELISPEAAQYKIMVKAKFKESEPSQTDRISTSKTHSQTERNSSSKKASLAINHRTSRSTSSVKSDSTTTGSRKFWDLFKKLSLAGRSSLTEEKESSAAHGSTQEDSDDDLQAEPSTGSGYYARAIYLPTTKLILAKTEKLPTSDTEAYSITSFNENAACAALKKYGLEPLREHHQERLSRVYPHATRIGSDNYDPVPMWLAGFQLCALNYQSVDVPTLINTGLFMHENGGCGYVLKPHTVRGDIDSDGDYAESHQEMQDAVLSSLSGFLQITVHSGHWLPKPPQVAERTSMALEAAETISPRVRVTVCGAPEDQCENETRIIPQNGFNPYWNESFVFKLAHPSLAILAFEVFNVKDSSKQEFVAAAAVPVIGIREGMRWVPLLDWRHEGIDLCGLLVEARLHGPWADLKRQQQLRRARVSHVAADIISNGPGGIGAPRVAQGRCSQRLSVRCSLRPPVVEALVADETSQDVATTSTTADTTDAAKPHDSEQSNGTIAAERLRETAADRVPLLSESPQTSFATDSRDADETHSAAAPTTLTQPKQTAAFHAPPPGVPPTPLPPIDPPAPLVMEPFEEANDADVSMGEGEWMATPTRTRSKTPKPAAAVPAQLPPADPPESLEIPPNHFEEVYGANTSRPNG